MKHSQIFGADGLRPEDARWGTRVGWRMSLWAMRLMFFVMPRGEARDCLGDHIRAWCAECKRQWGLRYGAQ